MKRLTVPRRLARFGFLLVAAALSAAGARAQGPAGSSAPPPIAAPAEAPPVAQPVAPIPVEPVAPAPVPPEPVTPAPVEPVPVEPYPPPAIPSSQTTIEPPPPSAAAAPTVAPQQAVSQAPSPPSAAAREVAEPPDVEPKAEGPGCLIGPICIGPVLTLGALDVLGFGAHARTDHWGIGIDYQFIWFSASGIPIRLSLLTVEGRVYPFGNAFFLAGGLAWQSASLRGRVTYSGSDDVPPIDAEVTGRINVPVLKLGIGFMGRSGFVLGIDLALGIQLGGNTVDFSSNLPRIDEVVEVEQKIRKRADTFVRDLPFLLQLNLIRLGFLF